MEDIKIRGTIVEVLPERRGISQKSGEEWRLAAYVIEYGSAEDVYKKKCMFEVFGDDKINRFNLAKGDDVEVYLDIDSKLGSKSDRWFNSIRAWKVERIQNTEG